MIGVSRCTRRNACAGPPTKARADGTARAILVSTMQTESERVAFRNCYCTVPCRIVEIPAGVTSSHCGQIPDSYIVECADGRSVVFRNGESLGFLAGGA